MKTPTSAPDTPRSRATAGATAGSEYAAIVASACVASIARSGQTRKRVDDALVIARPVSGRTAEPVHVVRHRRESAAVLTDVRLELFSELPRAAIRLAEACERALRLRRDAREVDRREPAGLEHHLSADHHAVHAGAILAEDELVHDVVQRHVVHVAEIEE